MIKVYKLDEKIQDALESLEIYKEKKMDEADENNTNLEIFREELEEYVEEKLDNVNLDYRSIKRAKTTSYVIKIFNEEENSEEEIKMTIRFDNDLYSSHKYTNITFNRDLDFYVGDVDF